MKRPRWKSLMVNLAVAAVSLGLCFAALEVILRLAGYGNVEIYQPDAALYWRLKPNQDCYTKIGRRPVHINSRGTRGVEFAVPKPSGIVRILALGDSRTFGWGLAEDETYCGRLQRLLEQQTRGMKKVEVINAGVNAWSYPQMKVYLQQVGVTFNPDFVVIGDANLWTQFSEKNSPEFVDQMLGRVRLKNLLRRFATYNYIVEVKLNKFYQRYKSRFVPIDPKQDPLFKEQQQQEPSAVFRDAIEQTCQVAATNGIKPILLFLPLLTELESTNHSDILEAKMDISRRLNVPLVDVTANLGRKAELYLDADPVHFNAAGNEIVARRLFETLVPLLSYEQVQHP